ncbi:MAG: ribonuclease, partial [Sphingomicrobium sp.]|nr:ribonuclease [Sphingomonadales bacterium]
MAEWLVERGIGETREVRVEQGAIAEARIMIDGVVRAGTVMRAVLKRGGRPAIAVADDCEYLLPKGAPGVTEGVALTIEVKREAIPGGEPWKRPLARVAEGAQEPEPHKAETLAFPAPFDRLETLGWSDLLDEARSGIVRFAGGELRVSPTPAMTLIDVDGTLAPIELAKAGAKAAARAILRHGIGGSIGLDLPTVAGKAERLAIAAEVDTALPQPFERTAVNGFGFLQIVRPRRHASLFELAADRAAFEARALLRRTAFSGAGAKRLVAHSAIAALLEDRPAWLEAICRQIGGAVTLRADPR